MTVTMRAAARKRRGGPRRPAVTAAEALAAYVAQRQVECAASTARSSANMANALNEVYKGPVTGLNPSVVDAFFALKRKTCTKGSSLNVLRSELKTFEKWLVDREMVDPWFTFTNATKKFKLGVPRERLYIPRDDFPRLLDSAKDPMDRAAVAACLYTFARQGEVGELRVGDIDPEGQIMHMIAPKTGKRHDRPLSAELAEEMDTWLRHYAMLIGGPVSPDMYLIPARSRYSGNAVPGVRGFGPARSRALLPYKKEEKVYKKVQAVLDAAGYPTEREGGHTLRRSGARALFLQLRDEKEGFDSAVSVVMAILGHAEPRMTLEYIGVTVHQEQAHKLIAGRKMFAVPNAGAGFGHGNVVPLIRREA